MAGPWEKYAPQATGRPWEKYSPTAAPAAVAAPPVDPTTLDLPVPDGQGGISTAYTPQDRGTPASTARAPAADPVRALSIGSQGMRQGVAELAGLPVDIMNAVMSLGAMGVDAAIPGEQSWRPSAKPFGGSGQLTDAFEAAMPGEPFSYDEMTDAQRLGFEMNRFGTQSLIPSLGLGRQAVRAALPGMHPSVAPAVEQISRPYTQGANALGDTIAGAGAGVGYGAYDMYTPDPVKKALGPFGDVFSSMGGAVGANLLENVAKGGAQAAKDVVVKSVGGGYDTSIPQNPDGSFVKNKDADLAAMYVQNKAANPGRAADTLATRATALQGRGTMPTSGILSDDPGLINYERGARLDPDQFNTFSLNQQGVETSALESAKKIAPETAIGRQFTDVAEKTNASRIDEARNKVGAAEQNLAGAEERNAQLASEVAASRGGKVPASERLDKTIVDDTLVPMQGESSRQFAAADPNGQSMISSDPLLDAADKVYRSLGDLNTPSKVIPQGLLARIEGTAGDLTPASSVETGLLDASGRPITRDTPAAQAPNEVSVRSIVDALPELATTEERARRAGNYTLADNIRELRHSMDRALDDASAAGNPEAAAAMAARQNYKDTVGATFGGGTGEPARKLRQDFNQDRFGRSTTPPSQTAQRFLQPGQPEKAASLKRILEASPKGDEGRKSVSEYLAADLAEAPGVVRANGSIDPKAIERWAQKWGEESLDLAPDFRSKLNDMIVRAGQGQDDSSQLATQLKETKAALQEAQANTGAIARVLGKDPARAVASILASGDPETTMRQIVKSIEGNESARNGLKASVREFLMERATTSAIQKTATGENPLSFAKLDEIFKQHENTLAEVFTPDEMHSLRVAHQLLAPLKNLEMKTVPGSQTTPLQKVLSAIALPLESTLKLTHGSLEGGAKMRIFNMWASRFPSGDAAAKELVSRMWFDPDLAQHLLKRDVSKAGLSNYNAKLLWLLSKGAGARDINESQDNGQQKREPIEVTVPTGVRPDAVKVAN